MFKYAAFILVSLSIISCSNNKESEEIPHVDKQKMAEVLTDLTLMEAAVTLKVTQDPVHPIDSSLRFNIYKQHNVSKEMYASSLTYYSKRPTEFKEIYDVVLEKLNQLKTIQP